MAMRLSTDCGAMAMRLSTDCGAMAMRLSTDCGAMAMRLSTDYGAMAMRLSTDYGAMAMRLSTTTPTVLISHPVISIFLDHLFLTSPAKKDLSPLYIQFLKHCVLKIHEDGRYPQ
jgi:hypothetical protein